MASTSAVVVTYNSEDAIGDCLEALAKFSPQTRVIVVDNASSDGTVAAAQKRGGVEVIANSENRGFAGAANQGFQAAGDATLVLLMNPDVCLLTGLEPLVEAAKQHGLAGGRLIGTDGSTQSGFTIRRFPSAGILALELLGINRVLPENTLNHQYRYLGRDLTQAGPADQPAGAFLMIRRDVWTKLGGLNEAFWPIWFEDVDFCRRAVAAGFEGWFVPSVTALHLGGHSIKKINAGEKQLYWYDNLLRYAGLHFGTNAVRFLCIAGMIGVLPRTLLGIIQERSLRPIAICFANLGFLGRRLVSDPLPESRRP